MNKTNNKVTAENFARVNFAALSLTFNTTAHVSRAATLHINGCSMVRASRKVNVITGADVGFQVNDLINELGYAVTICKCAHGVALKAE